MFLCLFYFKNLALLKNKKTLCSNQKFKQNQKLCLKLNSPSTGTARNKKGGELIFLLWLKHMQIRKFSFRQIVTNYKV